MTVTRRIGGARRASTTMFGECAQRGDHDECPAERLIDGAAWVCVCGCHRDPWPFPSAEAPELEHIVEITGL